MELREAIINRHSVRQFIDKPIEEGILNELRTLIEECNQESGLHIQLVTDEPLAFNSVMAHYGNFSGVSNYIVLVGKKDKLLDEKCGYYGERIVLRAQQLGLNSCWVAMTYKKIPSAFIIDKKQHEKLTVVIALGYGKTQGKAHKSKTIIEVSNASSETPSWFNEGVQFALLAPTAMNQQKFKLLYNNGEVIAKANIGFYSKLDLGIVKYHFEVGANKKVFNNL